MSATHPRSQRGQLSSGWQCYGTSVLGAPLLYFPAPEHINDPGLIIAGTHGDEMATIITLSCALRTLKSSFRRHHVILAVNPDGCQFGLRANAHGVDINRNFPAKNWMSGNSVYRWNSYSKKRDVLLKTGSCAGSEPETQSLCQLIERLKPAWVVSFHDPLGCIDDPQQSSLGHWLAGAFELPEVTDVGYDTPGSSAS